MKTLEEVRKELREVEDRWFDEWHETGVKPTWYYLDVQKQIRRDYNHDLQVGDHAHIQHYTDVDPVTVIKRTKSMIVVRYDKATLSKDWKPEFVLGGFSAHCTNNDSQTYEFEEDPDGATETFRWSEKFGQWRNTSGEKVFPQWASFYDYNF